MSGEHEVEQVRLDRLSFYPGNARRGDVTAIRESLRVNGQFAPLIVQVSTGHVLSGNHTLQAMLVEGWAEADVYWVDVDEPEARRIVLAANRTSDLASYDDSALLALIESANDDLLGTGFSDSDLTDLRAFVALTEEANSFSTDGDPEPAGLGRIEVNVDHLTVNVVVRKGDEARLYAVLSTLDYVLDARRPIKK